MNNDFSQNAMILKYLKTHRRGISQKEAAELFSCMRLSGRIFELRKAGHNIELEWVTEKNKYGNYVRYGRYRLLPQ